MAVRIASLCTGYAGLDLAVQSVFGGELAWWSDIEDSAIQVMEHYHPNVPNLGDLKQVDWHTVSDVEILTAGYPCTPFSNAGKRGDWTKDPRHLWPFIAEAIGILRPRVVILENVAVHLRRGFDVVLADLTHLGYDVAWCVVRASDAGAPHKRERLFVLAKDTHVQPREQRGAAAPGQAEGGGPRPDAGGRDIRLAPAGYAEGGGRGEGGAEHAGLLGKLDVAEPGALVDWDKYEYAVRRWESILGVEAPNPKAFGPRGGVKVNPAFAEWMMGIPGRLTSVPGLTMNQMNKMAGNGVVPQQAELAIRHNIQTLLSTKEEMKERLG